MLLLAPSVIDPVLVTIALLPSMFGFAMCQLCPVFKSPGAVQQRTNDQPLWATRSIHL